MSTAYTVTATEIAPFRVGTTFRVRAESTTPGCSHWYNAFVTRRGSVVVTELDDATGTRERRNLDGEEITLVHDDPRLREIMKAIEEYVTEKGDDN